MNPHVDQLKQNDSYSDVLKEDGQKTFFSRSEQIGQDEYVSTNVL